MRKKLSRGPHLDMSGLKREAEDLLPVYKELRERAIEFMHDKDNLEEAILEIQNSKISGEDKERIIANLNSVIDKLEKQFQQEVSEKEDELNEEQQEIIDSMREEAEEFQKQSNDLRAIHFKQSITDTTSAADEADSQKRELNEMEQQELERLRLQMEQQEQQRRYMQRRNISRR